jgi:PPK2 family polyphosphate:nucleotide phosphotransferase
MAKPKTFAPGKRIALDDIDPADTGKYKDKDAAAAEEEKWLKKLFDLQARLSAESQQALLIVLQGLDAAGKDGTIRHVFAGVNPQACQVHSFKAPTPNELAHDFLWRIHTACPPRGVIGIFNRSHYEDVLAVRVEKLLPEKVWRKRYDQINEFERTLTESGTRVLKFYLHISKKEQRARIKERLQDPSRNWKFSESDLDTRSKWRPYREAFDDALTLCNTEWAPWHVVPADSKWYRNVVIAETVVETLEDMNPKYPKPKIELEKYRALLK